MGTVSFTTIFSNEPWRAIGPSDNGECEDVSLNRVARLTRLAGITAQIGYKRRPGKDGGKAEPYPNAEERRVMYVALTRARRTVTILASEARPSIFVDELMKDPEFGVTVPLEAQKHTHTCPGCGGRLLHMAGKDGRDWYRCEHVKLCGSRMPACPACGVGLPVPSRTSAELAYGDCGETQQACPICEAGWLVERRGRYGAFLSCVRFPDCDGKAKLQNSA